MSPAATSSGALTPVEIDRRATSHSRAADREERTCWMMPPTHLDELACYDARLALVPSQGSPNLAIHAWNRG